MRRKGISLIVLVITIIVIIILTAAVIINLGNNNPIKNAKKAKVEQTMDTFKSDLSVQISNKLLKDTSLSVQDMDSKNEDGWRIRDFVPSIKDTEYESELLVVDGKLKLKSNSTLSDTIQDIIKECLGYETVNQTYPYNKAEEGVKVTENNATITGQIPNYDNPVIPVGFKTLETEKATWKDNDNDQKPDGWNEGLVILDENDNEYVWIPVEDLDEYLEKINFGYVNSFSVLSEEVEDDSLPIGISSEQNQIINYGGFYVARYEASLPDNMTTEELMKTKTFSALDNNKTDIGNAQSKENKIAWNRIDYENAKIVAENVISNEYVQTGLITGRQWDTMCKFIETAGVNIIGDSSKWGNYYYYSKSYTVNDTYYRKQNSDGKYIKGSYTKSSGGYLLLPTGIFAKSVSGANPKNLCDVAGNLWEWNTEKVKQRKYSQSDVKIGNMVIRGGSYFNDGHNSGEISAAYRGGNVSAEYTAPNVGFRFVIFIK